MIINGGGPCRNALVIKDLGSTAAQVKKKSDGKMLCIEEYRERALERDAAWLTSVCLDGSLESISFWRAVPDPCS